MFWQIGDYSQRLHEIPLIWQGGIGIYGAFIAACVTIYILSKKNKDSFLDATDILTTVLPLGQAIGRWGNYFNQELFGYPTQLPWALHIDAQYRPDQFADARTFHPTFLYESILNLINFSILYALSAKKTLKPGIITSLYCINYGAIRFIVDIHKIDPDIKSRIEPFSISQWVSIIIILCGIALLIYTGKSNTPQKPASDV